MGCPCGTPRLDSTRCGGHVISPPPHSSPHACSTPHAVSHVALGTPQSGCPPATPLSETSPASPAPPAEGRRAVLRVWGVPHGRDPPGCVFGLGAQRGESHRIVQGALQGRNPIPSDCLSSRELDRLRRVCILPSYSCELQSTLHPLSTAAAALVFETRPSCVLYSRVPSDSAVRRWPPRPRPRNARRRHHHQRARLGRAQQPSALQRLALEPPAARLTQRQALGAGGPFAQPQPPNLLLWKVTGLAAACGAPAVCFPESRSPP